MQLTNAHNIALPVARLSGERQLRLQTRFHQRYVPDEAGTPLTAGTQIHRSHGHQFAG